MKLRHALLLLSILTLGQCLHAQSKKFKLQGMIGGIKDKTIYLLKDTGEDRELLDSTTTNNGMFEFAGEINHDLLVRIQTTKHRSLPIFISPTEMELLIHVDSIKFDPVIGCLSGSPAQEQYESFRRQKQANKKRQEEIANILETLDGTQYPQKKKTLLQEYKHLAQYKMNYILEHAASPVAQYLVYKGLFDRSLHTEDIRKFVSVVPTDNTCIYYQNLKKRLEMKDRMSNGGQFPNFRSKTFTGDSFDLESKKGKYVLLYIWRSWNEESEQHYISDLRALKAQYPQQNLEIVSILRYSSMQYRYTKDMEKKRYIPKPQLQGLCTEIPSCDGELELIKYMGRGLNVFLLNPEGKVVFNLEQNKKTELPELLKQL